MTTGLSYRDAVELLGSGSRNPVVVALDRLTGGALLLASAAGAALPLSLFDAKGELFRLTEDLVRSATARLDRAKRADRTECLAAAHSTLVLAAYFDTLREVSLPFDLRELEITAREQVATATGLRPDSDLATTLLRSPAPMPQPGRPYEDNLAELGLYYSRLGRAVVRFMSGLAIWERITDGDQGRVEDAVRNATGRALRRYENLFQRLAVDFPEVRFWANLVDHRATRAELRELRTALSGLADLLHGISAGAPPDGFRARLAKSYTAALRRPALAGQEVPGGLRVPRTENSYINPNFKVGVDVEIEDIAQRSWWDQQPQHADLQNFLVGYLTNPQATRTPLMVMGQPGSGKSMLTKVLAARLPATDFFAVRVPLRELDTDADPQANIEQAVRAATGESLPWRKLAAAAGDATPVILVDGFDELLQATGQTHADYLEKWAEFQLREADLDRPVVVLVTTRMSMAHRARAPKGMSTVLLEPFDDEQISRWLTTWHDENQEMLSERGLCPLPIEIALRYRDLAGQPLLLLLLALYDADGNPLQHKAAYLDETELYERLLTSFSRREVRKSGLDLSEDQVTHAVDRELWALSVVAFAMFNRQQLWVAEAELDRDLAALTGTAPEDGSAALTAAQILSRRFYFVYIAQAIHAAKTWRTFEFLHGTFGEYLVARLIVHELTPITDDTLCHALLSFVPLTNQPNTVAFIRSLLTRQDDHDRLTEPLLRLFHQSLAPRTTSIDEYRPATATVPTRHATYSANLFVLLVLTVDELTAHQLFPGCVPAEAWSRTARLWQSQLPAQGWRNLVQLVTVKRGWDKSERVVWISYGGSKPAPPDLYWTYEYSPESKFRNRGSFSWIHQSPDVMRAEAAFLSAETEDVYRHALEPLSDAMGTAIVTFHDFRGRGPVSAARALLQWWVRSTQMAPTDELVDIAETCLRIAVRGFAPSDDMTRHYFRNLVLLQVRADRDRLPEDWVDGLVERIKSMPDADRRERDEMIIMTKQILFTH